LLIWSATSKRRLISTRSSPGLHLHCLVRTRHACKRSPRLSAPWT